jgi:hypothetical protein
MKQFRTTADDVADTRGQDEVNLAKICSGKQLPQHDKLIGTTVHSNIDQEDHAIAWMQLQAIILLLQVSLICQARWRLLMHPRGERLR